MFEEEGLSWRLGKQNSHLAGIFIAGGNDALAILQASRRWRRIEITALRNTDGGLFRTLSEIAFRTSILFFSGIVLHAAAISYRGRGLVFSAPAGTGKSTQASLWAQRGAIVLNADRPAIRVIHNNPWVFGTPWSGTTAHNLNACVPLKAIFLLEQGSLNEVEELSVGEVIRRLTARCFLPYFDKDLMAMALDNIGAIMERVPVYRLKCRPDPGAVDAVIKWLNL